MRELGILYAAFESGQPSPLPKLPVQVADIAAWQRRRFPEPALEQERAYWRTMLGDAPREVALPLDRPRSAGNAVERFLVTVDAQRCASMRAAVAANGGVFNTLWTAWAVTLHVLSGQHDLVVGTFSANRQHPATQDVVGALANLLAMRIRISGNETLGGLRKRLLAELLDGMEHGEFPFPSVAKAVQPTPAPGRNPMLNVIFQLQEVGEPDGGALGKNGIRVSPVTAPALEGSMNDVFLRVLLGKEMILVFLHKPHFDRSTMQSMAQKYLEILEQLVKDPEQPIPRPLRRTP